MLIPELTSIRVEDFPDQKSWIGKLLLPLNQFFLSTVSAVNGNITIGDNIPCQTQVMSFVYGSSTDFPKSFKWNIPDRPLELRIASATEDGVPIALVPAWSYANGNVSITTLVKLSTSGVSELVTGSTYVVTVRAEP